jgi:hypothetical protein
VSTPLVLCAPRREAPFKLYIDAEEKITDVILTQEDNGKKYVITYLVGVFLIPRPSMSILKNYAYCHTMHVLN